MTEYVGGALLPAHSQANGATTAIDAAVATTRRMRLRRVTQAASLSVDSEGGAAAGPADCLPARIPAMTDRAMMTNAFRPCRAPICGMAKDRNASTICTTTASRMNSAHLTPPVTPAKNDTTTRTIVTNGIAYMPPRPCSIPPIPPASSPTVLPDSIALIAVKLDSAIHTACNTTRPAMTYASTRYVDFMWTSPTGRHALTPTRQMTGSCTVRPSPGTHCGFAVSDV